MLGHVVELVLRLLARLPRPASQFIGRRIGDINYLIRSRSFLVTEANLKICFPQLGADERRDLSRASLANTGQTLFETPAAWFGKPDSLKAWISEIVGEEILMDALDEDAGVVILLPHVGNWELFNSYSADIAPITALYQPPRQDFMRPLMEHVRENFGHELVATNVKGLARLYRVLSDGGVVTILPDQVPANGVFADFFGVSTLTDILVSRLLQKTKAQALVVCLTRLTNGQFRVKFERADPGIYDEDIDISVRAVNASVEKCVRENPAQYQWEYKRFRERPVGEKKLYRFDKSDGFH